MNTKGKFNKRYSGKIPTFAMLKHDNLSLVSIELPKLKTYIFA
jgi:hypothetical protein